MRTTNAATVMLAAGIIVFGQSTARADGVDPRELRCDLFNITGVEDSSTASCIRCHGSGLAAPAKNHPVDVDYALAATRTQGAMMELRPAPEVIARGVFLPEGQIRCVTCHDGRSPWKFGIALPPNARVKPAVNPRDPTTYEEGPELRARQAELLHSNERFAIAVSPKPLCLACHALD